MKPGQAIEIQMVDSCGQPLRLSNVYVELSFYTHGNYRYSFLFGPTDNKGAMRIEYQDVERERMSSVKECVMDYNTTLDACDNRVKFNVPSSEQLRKSFDVATRWAGRGTTPEYAKGWLTAENTRIKANDVSAELKTEETIISIPCEVI